MFAITGAISFQFIDIPISDEFSVAVNGEGLGASQWMQLDTAVTVNQVTSLVGAHQLHAFTQHSPVKIIDTGLGVIGHEGHVVRRGLRNSAESGGGVSGVEPRGEDGAASGVMQPGKRILGGGGAAGGLNIREELVGKVERAANGIGLFGEGRDRGRTGLIEE